MSDPFDHFGPDSKTRVRTQWKRDTYRSKKLPPPPWGSAGQLEHFSLLRFVALGGGGYVYIARDEKAGKNCAVKIIPSRYDHLTFRNRLGFRRMMLTDHPNLLKVDRIHVVKDYNVLTMEEIEGDTLYDWARRTRETIKPDTVGEVFQQVISLIRDYSAGLSEMHSKGLLHRDIKLANLMVTPEGRGVIIDYGCVCYYSFKPQPEEGISQQAGTRGYVAPEVIARRRHYPASDIYSLGMVLNACLHYFSKPFGIEASEILVPDSASAPAETRDSAPMKSDTGTDAGKAEGQSPDDAEQLETKEEVNERHELTLRGLADLPSIVPELLQDACREMLEFDPDERPTAARLARLGLSSDAVTPLNIEDPIFGRDEYLDQMDQWAREVCLGQPSRLNIVGDSCLGKTRLLTEFVQRLESTQWAQVFVGRCRAREDAPFQAFTQIIDAIVDRYLGIDREKISLDAPSSPILCYLFPELRNVVVWDEDTMVPVKKEPTREDSLSAARALCEKLVEVGPIFIVIDDSQWSDQDSLYTLDYLRTVTEGLPVGIVTATHSTREQQRVPADLEIRLQPLSLDDSCLLLEEAAENCGIHVDPEILRRYAVSTDGNPFRLQELALEMRPGGELHALDGRTAEDSDPEGIRVPNQFWNRRYDSLSDEAKQILLLVATGGSVSIKQLKKLTKGGDATEAAVTELSRARLVQDDATGGECISTYHNRIAEELIVSFGEERTKDAHSKWAKLFVEQGDEAAAARTAGHLIGAGLPHQAVRYAVQAAENADQLTAPAEAGRWYEVAAKYCQGREKINYLYEAAKSYQVAEQPRSGADCYKQLVNLIQPGAERNQCLRDAVVLSIHSGAFASVKDSLRELANQFDLPLPKSAWRSRLCSLLRCMKLAWSRRGQKQSTQNIEGIKETFGIGSVTRDEDCGDISEETRRNQIRLELCHQLARPISMFDNPYSLELNLLGSELATHYGNESQRINMAVGEAVFFSYGGGSKRVESEQTLFALQNYLADSNNVLSKSDVWSGIACVNTLAMRWRQVDEPLQLSLNGYRSNIAEHHLEIAHSEWMELWASWHRGRWAQMVQSGRRMIDDATQRGDRYFLRMTCTGFGIGIWITEDRLDQYDRVWQQVVETDDEDPSSGRTSTELIHVFEWISDLMRMIYEGDFDSGWERLVQMQRKLNRSHFQSIQMLRVIMASFKGILALHQYSRSPSQKWVKQTNAAIKSLRNESEAYPQILANFYAGILLAIADQNNSRGDHRDKCVGLLRTVAKDAETEKLRPLQLAALDLLSELRDQWDPEIWKCIAGSQERTDGQNRDFADDSSEETGGQLIARMRRRGVAEPEKLARLYTVDLRAIG